MDSPQKKFPRGAKPTPRHKLLAATPHRPTVAAPAQFAVVPKQLSMWGNQQYGDCVTAEEAFAKACAALMAGYPEVFVPEQTAVGWANARGFLDGAVITDVMDAMQKTGFQVGPQLYNDGPYHAVDYSNEAVLQSAISQGPVKLGLDADALPQTAGSQQGWYAVGGTPEQFRNEDHCTGLCGYGPAAWLFEQLGVPLPAALQGKSGYLFFTWSTIGFVDHAWIMSTVAEAWLRTPTTVGVPPLPGPTPTPTPTPPTPTPVPPTYDIVGTVKGLFGASQTFTGTATPRQNKPHSQQEKAMLELRFSPHPVQDLFRKLLARDFAANPLLVNLTGDQIHAVVHVALYTPTVMVSQALGTHPQLKGLTPDQIQLIINLVLQLLPIILPLFLGS